MAGIPGLQHVECLGAADFADNDPVGTQAQGRADKVCERHRSRLGPQLHRIARRRNKFARVFEDDQPVAGQGDFGKEGIGECCLAGACAADHENVLAVPHGLLQGFGVMRCHDAGGDILTQSNHPPGRLADRETGPGRYGRQNAFEPFPAQRQLSRHDGRGCIDPAAHMAGNQPDHAFSIGR